MLPSDLYSTGSSPQNFLVVVNPYSGNKKSQEVYENVVCRLFKRKNVTHELFVTQYAGHCFRRLKKMKNIIKVYTGIVGIGGDGVISEIFQGLWKNSDSNAKLIPIGHIPGGSGNGLAMSILRKSAQPYGAQEAASIIAKTNVIGMDLMEICSEEKKFPAFLTVSWGALSTLDIVSESFRFLRGYRFYIGAIIELWRMNHYSGTLSYLPDNKKAELPKLSEQLPDEFVQVTGNFNVIIACNTTDCSYNAYTAPQAKFNDGFVRLIWVMSDSRWTMLSVFLGLEDGSYFNNSDVQCVKTRAFRFVPSTASQFSLGALTVDGEVLPNLPIQCRVRQAAANIFCS